MARLIVAVGTWHGGTRQDRSSAHAQPPSSGTKCRQGGCVDDGVVGILFICFVETFTSHGDGINEQALQVP